MTQCYSVLRQFVRLINVDRSSILSSSFTNSVLQVKKIRNLRQFSIILLKVCTKSQLQTDLGKFSLYLPSSYAKIIPKIGLILKLYFVS